MELRSRFEKVVVASLFSGALLFLSGCGIAGQHPGMVPSRVSFGPRCPSCMLTRATGCQCTPDGWSHGQTVWRPLTPECTDWLETTNASIEHTVEQAVEQADVGPYDRPYNRPYNGEPELAPTEGISAPHKTTLRHSTHDGLLPKWGAFWLGPKPVAPLVTPSEMAFPTPERLDRIASVGI